MILLKSRMSPSRFPVRIGPPDTMTAGIFRRAVAIIIPGTILFAVGMSTRPSRACPLAMASMESQMSSRLASGYFMPSCPIAMPSQMPTAGNSRGVPPARRIPLFTACATRSRPVSWNQFILRIDDADERTVDFFLYISHSVEKRTHRRSARALFYFITVHSLCLS